MNVFDNLSTLTLLGGLVTLVIVLMTVAQGVFAFAYARLLWMAAPAKRDDSGELPKAAVVLSLRGADPYLTTCIQAVLEQDYPEFTLFIVVDSPQDSAWEDVHQIQSRTPPGRVVSTALANRLTTCSLKCCALAEVVENLDPSYAVVAFLDGDGAPHRHWLRDRVAALRDHSVGVSTGNRWYTPDQVTWGAMVRYFWNAGAIVQVWLNGIIWAGSMALRRETIREIDLIDAWRKSLSVDGAVVRQTQAHGYKARFVPTVILPNREDI
ncbi:MAG: glycosyltransferase family 2 protein, partial [Pirellulaceae bacterium]|nr:glycosyltransferase family 2 protein [Pirellulaceae bacterium]